MAASRSHDVRVGSDPSVLSPTFLAIVCRSAGASDEVAHALADRRTAAAGPEPIDWVEVLEQRLHEAGAVLRPLELTPREAVEAAGDGLPLVTWDAALGWLALLDGREHAAQVIDADRERRWRALGALERQLGTGPRRWIVVRADLSAASRSARRALTPFGRLVEIVRPDRGDVLAIVLYSAFIGLLTLAIPIAVQQLVNTVAFGGLFQPVVVLAFLLLLGLAVSAALAAFQAYLAEIMQRRLFVRACLDLSARLPRVAHDAFGRHHAPAFVNRFFDLVTLQKTGARLLLEGSAVLLQAATGLLILSFYHPLMLGLSVVLLSLMSAVAFVMGRGAANSALRESTAKYALAAWMEELVRHGTLFRSAAGRAEAAREADRLASSWVSARRLHYRIVFRQLVGALSLQALVNTLVLALGGVLVVAGELTLGQLVASEIIVAAVVAAFSRLAKHFEAFYDVLAATEKVGGLLDLELERGRGAALRLVPDTPAALEVNDVSFGYGSRKVLRGLQLELAAGESVAISGGAASGKSTLIDVLAGILSPDSGYVTLGGQDLRDLAPQSIRDRVYVVREPQILPGTVRENLALVGDGISVEHALDRVGLLDEVRALPEGLSTPLGADGRPLSGSQAVRIEIARALIAQPRFLLIDEALTTLDDATLEPVLGAIFDPEAGMSVVVVTRDERIRSRCSRSLRLEAGRLVEAPADTVTHGEGA